MSSLVQSLIVLPLIYYGLCASDLISVQDDGQSGSSLGNIAKRKIASERLIFDDEQMNKEVNSAFNKELLGIKELKQDEKRYDEQDTVRKGYDKGRHSLGESEAVDQGRNSLERHGNRYYKKGHRKTGFSNSYHQDESGNNSSFYEDSDDEGGHRLSDNSGGYYGQKSQDSFRDGVHDIIYKGRDRAEQGMHENRRNLNDYHDYIGRYNDDRLKNHIRNYLNDDGGNYFNRNGNHKYNDREKFYSIMYRNNDYVPSLGYNRYYIDTLPRGYYKGDSPVIPYWRDYRYFPHRLRDYERQRYYPYKGYDSINYRDDLYDNKYVNKFTSGFDNGYDRF